MLHKPSGSLTKTTYFVKPLVPPFLAQVEDHLNVGFVIFLVLREPGFDFGFFHGESLEAVLLAEGDDPSVAVQEGRLGYLVGVFADVVEVDDVPARIDHADLLDRRGLAVHAIGGPFGVGHHRHVPFHGDVGGVGDGIEPIEDVLGVNERHVGEIDLEEVRVVVKGQFHSFFVQEAERLVHRADVELAVDGPVLEPERSPGHLGHQVEDVGRDARIHLGRQARQGKSEEGEAKQYSFHGGAFISLQR